MTDDLATSMSDDGGIGMAGRRIMRNVHAAAERMADEHPLDTLLRDMLDHGWADDDPMVRWVRQAMKVPYPMPRWEAYERGLLTPGDE